MWKRPWIMTQEWHHVLFLHWPVSPEEVRELIPSELELDLYDNRAWIGLVFFQVKRNRGRLMPPVPGLQSYLELNVRTYVTYKGKSGVHFFSLDASHPIIVKLTTLGNFLPYRYADISFSHYKIFSIKSIYMHKHALAENLITTFKPIARPVKSTFFNHWLTERYCLWTKTKGKLYRIDISHSPWVLQDVIGQTYENTMASYIKNDFQLKSPVAHYSKMKKARFFPPILEK
ncbi:YqjF family protein [Bacillus sp. FJAT-22090]|uniref:YqjF family protein n=1 Tax=Bacillus sp. FJAT-22090 TaxID=1581038 RepID=UPI0011A900A5|nr:DUF2071 domain-containing protein [Bacillus sp. FJAT-22090]